MNKLGLGEVSANEKSLVIGHWEKLDSMEEFASKEEQELEIRH